MKPRAFELLPEGAECLAARRSARQCFRHGLSGQHAGLHGRVAALDLGHVEEAGIVTNQQAARHCQLRQGRQAAFDNRPGAVGDARAAFEHIGDQRVVLEALELVKRADMRIRVGKIDDQAEGNLIVLQVIKIRTGEQTAEVIARPSHGVQHLAGHVIVRIDVPELLEADGIVLGAGVGVQIELLDQLLAEMAATAFGEQIVYLARSS